MYHSDIYQYVRCIGRNNPEHKYGGDLNKLLQKTKENQQQERPLCFPIHLYCLAVPRDRISPFLLGFFQAEIHICALYTSPTAGSADVHAARGSRACHGCVRAVPDLLGSPVSSTWPQQATQAPRSTLRTGPSVPAELL